MNINKGLKYVLIFFSFSIQAEIILPVIDPNLPNISYVSYQSLDPVKPLTVSGQLRTPIHNANETLPAVLIVHGSAGIDSRGKFYAEALNKNGIATLEIDLWSPRGLAGGLNRPRNVSETLPDAYGALKFLSSLPYIDQHRIGIMGFSWGGIVSMLSSTNFYTNQFDTGGIHFAAHLAHYPICWIYNRAPGFDFKNFTGSPVLIQAGDLDTYDKPDTCKNLVKSLPNSDQSFISVNLYSNATHAWDRLQPEITIFDSVSHLGQGGNVIFTPNPIRALQSRANAVNFFKKWL